MKRDYYEILGVERSADEREIKKAYRLLARNLHPDVNDHDPDSEEKFKEATEAYEVLTDPEKRKIYDAYGHAGLKGGAGAGAGGPFGGGGFTDFEDIFSTFFGGDMFGGGQRGRSAGPARGRDLGIEIELDLHEAAFGTKKDVEVERVESCDACAGTGSKDPSAVASCPECGGAGRVRSVRRTPFGQFMQTGPCVACGGTGQSITDPCEECSGTGRDRVTRTLTVDIPAGVASGQRIRLTGQGNAGDRGGPAGDLYVEVEITPHPEFDRQGDDILYRQDLTMVQAALGATVTVPTLDGEEEVHFAAGTQPGEVKVLRARGVPHLRGTGRGDQHILANVMIPRDLDEQQRGLLEELDECCGIEHYAERSEGLFNRLRHLFTG